MIKVYDKIAIINVIKQKYKYDTKHISRARMRVVFFLFFQSPQFDGSMLMH
jgi:hypothetical protein